MKKSIALVLALMLILSTVSLTAFAVDTVDVYVTISDENGKLVLTQEKITVSDIDGDDMLTINDALYAAHEAEYEGGAAEGYAAGESAYGLSLNKLWGVENGGSYGYYVNNASAWSLADVVNDGDYITAFIYTDLTAWSDQYTYFDANTATAEVGKEIAVTLSAAGFDAEYNPVTLPVADAIITVNGEATEYKTDAEGKANIVIDAEGTYVVSAVSDTQILVPAVCMVSVSSVTDSDEAAPTEDVEVPTEEIEEAAPTEEIEAPTEEAEEAVTAPETGDSSAMVFYVVLMVAALVGIAVVTFKARKTYEK